MHVDGRLDWQVDFTLGKTRGERGRGEEKGKEGGRERKRLLESSKHTHFLKGRMNIRIPMPGSKGLSLKGRDIYVISFPC